MKTSVKLIIGAIALCVVLIAYYSAYYYAKQHLTADNIIIRGKSDSITVPIDMVEEHIIDNNTKLVIENVNQITQVATYDYDKIPSSCYGDNRDKYLQFIKENQNYYDKTGEVTVNVSLMSFSNDEIVLKRIFTIDTSINDSYYVIEEDSIIVVYRADKTTLFFSTGIRTDNFNEEDKAKIKVGFMINSLDELFSYIEGHSS